MLLSRDVVRNLVVFAMHRMYYGFIALHSVTHYTNASLSEIFVGVVSEIFEILELLDCPDPL